MKINKEYFAVTIMLLLGVLLFSSSVGAQSDTIGLVNLQAVFQSHPGLESAQAEYQEAINEIQAEIADMSEEEQQQFLPQFQQIAQQIEAEIQQSLMLDIEKAMLEVAADMNFSTVLDSSSVLIGGNDITEEVIAALN